MKRKSRRPKFKNDV